MYYKKPTAKHVKNGYRHFVSLTVTTCSVTHAYFTRCKKQLMGRTNNGILVHFRGFLRVLLYTERWAYDFMQYETITRFKYVHENWTLNASIQNEGFLILTKVQFLEKLDAFWTQSSPLLGTVLPLKLILGHSTTHYHSLKIFC